MPINFNDADCQSQTTHPEFGLRDDENSTPAYISHQSPEHWNATVYNPQNKTVTFTAVDHCLNIRGNDGNLLSTCDGILTCPGDIIFVELKNKRADWIQEGIDQLQSAIDLYVQSANLSVFARKKAHVANRRHPNFHRIENETKQRFFSRNRVRLFIDSYITI